MWRTRSAACGGKQASEPGKAQAGSETTRYRERLYAAPFELPYATYRNGTASPLVMIFFYPRHDSFYRLGVRRRNHLETAVALRALPKMDDLAFISILGPFGGNQLIAALNAVCSEA
jgi:hypothetical protein